MLKTLFSALVDQLAMQGISGQFSSAARALVKLLSSPVLAQIVRWLTFSFYYTIFPLLSNEI
jgi:hypothetical protein